MAPLDLLRRLTANGIELRARGAELSFKAPAGALDAVTVESIRQLKPDLLRLLDGSTCRWCGLPMARRGTPAVSLADGTSLHGECRTDFDIDRIERAAKRGLSSTLTADPAEVVVRGELDAIEREFSR
ncbi:TubC N-terminal docking domain-related protein [Geminicoccus roseus]|uniref:TubC N-terminal docking domain-related protein n=1 Tax=Geminicoccus roseus TaxID=404900 RepID=UPI00048785D2|nr:hypothetical protein [Geminicoccus roseus]